MPPILTIGATDIRNLLSPPEAVDVLTAVLRSDFDPAGDLRRASIELPLGSFLIMPSAAGAFAGIKIVSVAPVDPHRTSPRIQASYNLYDAQSLTQIALLDGTELTTLRTPAVSMLAIRSFLPEAPSTLSVVIFGTGAQGQGHAVAIKADLAALGATAAITFVTRATGVNEMTTVLSVADIVICATTSRTPLFDSSLLKDDVIVVAVGSHEPEAREVDSALCRRAHVIVEDVNTALRESGDIVQAIAEGALSENRLIPLKHVVMHPENLVRDRPVFFKSSGMSWEDLALASTLYTRATNS
jgi:ornithine cyclodeaminase/alanine dehydrogenase-like protein (mu-crystallin family)